MPTEPFLLLGAGGHARVVLDAWLLSDPAVVLQIRDDASAVTDLLGRPVSHPALPERFGQAGAHIAIGHNGIRRTLAETLLGQGVALHTVCHPQAVCSPHARIGAGTFLAAQSVVAPQALVGEGVIVNHGAVIDHDCTVGAWCHIAPRAVLGGGVSLGEGVLLGSGAVVLPGLRIGRGAIIGAGAVVTRDVPEGQSWVGIPARNRHG